MREGAPGYLRVSQGERVSDSAGEFASGRECGGVSECVLVSERWRVRASEGE